jgi:molybdopterin-binding protein
MNSFKAVVIKIISRDYINFIKVSANEIGLNILTLQLNDNITEGKETSVIFKESEVIITKDFGCFIGIDNIIPSIILDMNVGMIFCEILLDSVCGKFKALITVDSLKKIRIYKGDRVFAMIKPDDMAFGYD